MGWYYRFYDIVWGVLSDEYLLGVVVGVMEDGFLQLWDVQKFKDSEDVLILCMIKYIGFVKLFQFNFLRLYVFVMVGLKGEFFIWDVNDILIVFCFGIVVVQDIECVVWNRKVFNILVVGSVGGFVLVWDFKMKKLFLILIFRDCKFVSVIVWDLNNLMSFFIVMFDDISLVIFFWNLRNLQVFEKIF